MTHALAFIAGIGFGVAGALAFVLYRTPPPPPPPFDVVEDDDDPSVPESIRVRMRKGAA